MISSTWGKNEEMSLRFGDGFLGLGGNEMLRKGEGEGVGKTEVWEY